MNKFIRIGEKISSIYINKINIEDFSIIIPACGAFRGPSNCDEWIKKAARILQSYIFKLTEIELPIYLDSYPLRTKGSIIFGNCLKDGVNSATYNDDEHYYAVKNNCVFFNGGKRGIQYGVYTFLEKYLGLCFFSYDVERIKYQKRIDLNNFEERYNPPFEYREICDFNAWDPDFSVKSKLNGNFVRKLREEDGYSVGFAGGFNGLVHTFSKLVDKSLYKDNPDFFALDGKVRNPNGLCFSNPETIDTMVWEALKWLDNEKDPTLISISINDDPMVYCRCEECQKLIEQGYNDTDLVIELVNKVSRRIHEKYPHVKVETLIYHKTITPPNVVKVDDDVIIRYCVHSMRKISVKDAGELYLKTKDERLKQSYDTNKTIEVWSKIAKKMYIWDYPYNYSLSNVIFPIWPSLLDNMKFYYDHNAKGVYINGQSDTASFSELRTYLLSKIMFNPLMKKEEYENYINEFLEGFYGSGYQYIKEYMALSLELSNPYFSNNAAAFDIIPKNNSHLYISKGTELLNKAYSLARDNGEKNRIKKLKLTIDYYDLFANQEEIYKSNNKELIKQYISKYKHVYRDSLKFGISRLSENIFIPVVKNFNQPIIETTFWELKGKAYQDRNNESYPRKMYILIPVDEELGKDSEIEILCKTNNENKKGYINTYISGKFVSSGINPKWKEYKEYKMVKLKGTVTNMYEISEKFNMPINGLYLCYIPIEQKGIFVEMNEMDPGAYITFKKVE